MLRAPDADCKLADQVCPKCGAKGRFARHGSFVRNLVVFISGVLTDTKVSIRRVRCKSCKATHALIPFEVVPYCQHSTSVCAKLFELRFICGLTIERVCATLDMTTTTFYRIYKRSQGRLSLLVDLNTPFGNLFKEIASLVETHLTIHKIKPFESGRLYPAHFNP